MKTLRERLAWLSHDQWSGWMEYMFSKSTYNDDGSITIPKDLVDRWTRQMNTDYLDLPEKEKDSDRIEADRMIAQMTMQVVGTEGILTNHVLDTLSKPGSLEPDHEPD